MTEVEPGMPPVTIPGRTAWEIAREPEVVEAVVALDVLLSHNYVRAETLARLADVKPRSRGARAIRLTDGRAESPQESRTRVMLALAGYRAPVVQYTVRSTAGSRLVSTWPGPKRG